MAFRSSASSLGASGVNNVTVNAPAGVSLGDIILVMVDNEDGNTFTWPTGFNPTTTTAFASLAVPGSSHGRADTAVCAWKLATASEPSTYTIGVATGGAGLIKCVIGAWIGRASAPGTPIVTNESGNGLNPVSVSLTGYTANAGDDIAVFILATDTNTAGSWATTSSSGFTSQQDLNNTGTFQGGTLNLSSKDNVTAGATGNFSFTETGTGLVATNGADTSGIVIPLPAASGGSTAPVSSLSPFNLGPG